MNLTSNINLMYLAENVYKNRGESEIEIAK